MNADENSELMKRFVDVLFCDAEKADIEELKRFVEYLGEPLSKKEQRKLRTLGNRIMKIIREETTRPKSKFHNQ